MTNMRKYESTPVTDIDIPPRLPEATMAPRQLLPEESYVPRLNVSAEMANDLPPIVILTSGIALQGTEKNRVRKAIIGMCGDLLE